METVPVQSVVSSIPDFYAGRSVFVTGGTGCMGQVLIDRLLRGCPNISAIYILIRPRNGICAKDRLVNFKNKQIFDRVRAEDVSLLDKVVLVEGDVTQSKLGMSNDDFRTVCQRCTVFFHNAAYAHLNSSLRRCINSTLRGTHNAIRTAFEFEKLEAFVHNSSLIVELLHKKHQKEEITPLHFTAMDILNCNRWMSDSEFSALETVLRTEGGWTSGYPLSKKLSELLLQEMAEDWGANPPIAIIRPPFVFPSSRDPFPGWNDSFGVSGSTLHPFFMGLTSSPLPAETSFHFPVDMCCNAMVAAAWYILNFRPSSIPVFCLSQDDSNISTLQDACTSLRPIVEQNPSTKCIGKISPSFTAKRGPFTQSVGQRYDVLRSYFYDQLGQLGGQKPWRCKMVVNSYNFGHALAQQIPLDNYKIDNNNTARLYSLMSAADQQTFDFNMKKIDWPTYYAALWLGQKKFLYKEDAKTCQMALQRYRRMTLIRRSGLAALATSGFVAVASVFSCML